VRAGILGGGMIGAGWAELLRAHGHEARVYDERRELCRGAGSVAEAVHGADLVVEAVAERLPVKQAVLAEAAAHAPAGALIASASSSILPTVLQEGLPHPARVLVIHPLHPVTLIPVVEVVPGSATAPAAVEEARRLLLGLGKIPVVLRREVQGYVVNRLAAALWREAIDLVLQGVVDVETLDLAVSRGPCLGWAVQGPFLTYELAAPGGLGPFMEHLHPAFASIWRTLARWDSLPAGALDRLDSLADEAYGHLPRHELEAERGRTLRRYLQTE
jgi:3-hydroxyacyl-CoA dehydrogenase